jgi:hypothetical protein
MNFLLAISSGCYRFKVWPALPQDLGRHLNTKGWLPSTCVPK